MPDLLVPLTPLPTTWSFLEQQEALGITVRKPIGTEHAAIVAWVGKHFNGGWASEAARALNRQQVSCFVAVSQGELVGFSCYDATAPGYFGPTGVAEAARGRGTGKALLLAALLDMRLQGYGYAIIGWAGPVEFYKNAVGAWEIPNQTEPPGIYRGMLKVL